MTITFPTVVRMLPNICVEPFRAMSNLASISNTELRRNIFDITGYVFPHLVSDSGEHFENYFRNTLRSYCSSSVSLRASSSVDFDENYNFYNFVNHFLNELIGGFVSESAFLDRLFVDKPSATITLDSLLSRNMLRVLFKR